MNAEIIIVTYGQPKLEAKCIESVEKCTNLEQHRLTVVNNFIRDKNLGSLWNELIESSTADFVCLLNSDTVVEPDWLDKMITCAEECKADAVGPTTDHCGYSYQMVPRGKFYKGVSQLSGFCLLLRRSSWQKAGGFREDAPFYGQESNLLLRLGYKVLCGGVFVHHEAGASVKASRRAEEERALSAYWWPRNTKFNWKNRLAILGAPDSTFPLWTGINQAVAEFAREGMVARHFCSRTVTREELLQFEPTAVIAVSQRWDNIMECVKLVEGLKVPKACWFNDLRGGERAMALRGFDRAFLCFKDSRGPYSWTTWRRTSGAVVSYMPQGSVISTELKPLSVQKNLIFVGGVDNNEFHPNRRGAVHTLRAEVINEVIRNKRLEIELKTPTLYRQSRFVLSISLPVPGYSSIRLYNIMAYGGLALVAKFPGLEDMFQSERDVLAWGSFDEAEKLMYEWGNREAECEVVRKRAWRLQQAKHTVASRLMNMVANMTTSDQTFWGEA